MDAIRIVQGDGPLVLGLPHTGTYVPPEMRRKLNDRGKMLADTDWNVHKLYDGLLPGATLVRAMFHRYVIDANRDPSGQSLNPGQTTTDLVPLTDFDGHRIWDQPPSGGEIEYRRATWHEPYHAALAEELERVRRKHGVAILYDCHSIRSRIPFLFEGRLADFNIGTNDGATCATALTNAVEQICRAAGGYETTVNGRFKGGWTIRHHGRPQDGIHAIQMELAQSTYMEEAAPWPYLHDRAEALRPHLSRILHRLESLALNGDLA